MPDQQMATRLAANLATLVAVSLLVGWFVAFRARTYVGWLGLSFLSLALMFHLRRAELIVKVWPFVLATGFFFLLAFIAAAKETAQRLRSLRESHRAAEEAFLEMVKAGLAKQEEKGGPQQEVAPPQDGQAGDGGGTLKG